MPRDLDSTLAAGLPAGVIQPVFLAQIALKSGTEYLWSGVGDLVWGSPAQTFKGVGDLGSVGPISEGAEVKADGTFVTLSGLGLAQFPFPSPGVTPPPSPISPIPGGESLAWGYATEVAPTQSGTGAAKAGLYDGVIEIFATVPPVTTADRGTAIALWQNFALPPLPADAVIDSVSPVIIISQYAVGESDFIQTAGQFGLTSSPGTGTFVGGPFTSPGTLTVGASTWAEAFAGLSAQIELGYSLDGAVFLDQVTVSFIGVAVYYSSVSGSIPNPSLLYEALEDVQIGGPAKIWFGLMSDGELLGTPYLVFSGTVDKPTVKIGADSTSIELALENRLVNLQRATQRRYTAADQHLAYPNDLGFNWVEILQDIALVWGGGG